MAAVARAKIRANFMFCHSTPSAHQTPRRQTKGATSSIRRGDQDSLRLLIVFFQLKLIAALGPSLLQRPRRQLQDRMRHQAEGDSPAHHIWPDLQDLAVAIQKYDIDSELHGERMDAFAGDDPQPLARSQPLMLQQAGAPRGAGVGDIGPVGQNPPASLIRNTKLGQNPA